MRLPPFLHAFRAAGAANELVAPWTFVSDDGLFLTKTRALGAVIRLEGIDYECLDPREREAIVRRWATTLNLWDEHYRIYQYLVKSRHPSIPAERPDHPVARRAIEERLAWFDAQRTTLYAFELYVVILYEGWAQAWPRTLHHLWRAPIETIKSWGSTVVLDDELQRAAAEFRQRLDTWLRQVTDLFQPTLLTAPDAFRMLWRLLNQSADVPAPYDPTLPLDWTLVDGGDIDCYRDHLRVQDHHVRVLTLKRLPGATWAHQLEALYAVPGPMIVCSEWRRESSAASHHRLTSMRRHFHAAKVSIVTYLQARRPQRHEVLVDDSADAIVDELGRAMTAITLTDQYFGEYALTVVVGDTDPHRLETVCAEVRNAFSKVQATWIDERANILNAWLGIMPGNTAHQVRRMRLLNVNASDLAFLFTLHTGDVRHPELQREYLAVLETSHRSPYFLDLQYHDVGHALVLGASGSGKSFCLNFLLTHAMKYAPRVLILDIGASYQKLTEYFGGSYVRLTLEPQHITINPWCLPPTRDNLDFLASFVRVLIGAGHRHWSPRDEHEVHEQVGNLYSLDPSLRRLSTLADMLPKTLAVSLQRWVREGPYASIFDHAVDNLTFAAIQTFDLAGLDSYPTVVEPLLFYLLHRASIDIHDPTRAAQVKIAVVDEAWRFVRDPRIKRFVREALKTWRKAGASMWLATQSAEDFAEQDLLRTVIESCPSRLFLANPGLDIATYRDLFNLNDITSQRIRDLVPREQLLLQRPDRAKLLTLRVDAKSRWLYTNTPRDNARAHEAFASHGLVRGLDVLAAADEETPSRSGHRPHA